ncbi:MAG: gamma-glutamylcyclotransferase family protein [Leadbetterella sp.]
MTDYLFVYGSIQSCYVPNTIFKSIQDYVLSVQEAHTIGSLYIIEGGYPALVEEGHDIIKGELFEIQHVESLFKILDEYEEYDPNDPVDSLYIRKKARITLNSHTVWAWIYVYNQGIENKVRM